jgi:hypothetical protein
MYFLLRCECGGAGLSGSQLLFPARLCQKQHGEFLISALLCTLSAAVKLSLDKIMEDLDKIQKYGAFDYLRVAWLIQLGPLHAKHGRGSFQSLAIE